MCFSHFREKCPPKLPISTGRGEGKGTSQEPGLRPADRSSLGLCGSYILGLGRADSLCGYTSDSEQRLLPCIEYSWTVSHKVTEENSVYLPSDLAPIC